MNVSYVYLRCSRQLLRWKCQQRSSGFVSLGQLVGNDNDSRTMPQELPLGNGESAGLKLPRRNKALMFAQVYREQRKPKGVDKVLETLFASNRENEQPLRTSRYSRQPIKTLEIERSAIEHSIERRLRELHNELLRGTAPLLDIWTDCESLLDEKYRMRKDAVVSNGGKPRSGYSSTSVRDPANFHIFRDILVAISKNQRLVIDGRYFTPADAIKVYMKHGMMRHWWQYVLWCQLGHALQMRYQSTPPHKTIRILLGEILEVWGLYMKRYGLQDKTSTSEPPSSSFPNQPLTKLPDDITVAAAMTLECLSEAQMRPPTELMDLFNRFGQALEIDQSLPGACFTQGSLLTSRKRC